MEKNRCKLRDMLEWADGTSAYKDDFMKKTELYSKIIIFGAGIGGKKAYELLMEQGMEGKIEAFCDNNRDKVGNFYLGKAVIAPESIEKEVDRLVAVCSTAYDLISEQLMEMGIKEDDIYYFQPAGISFEQNDDMVFIKENIDKFEEVYEQLEDEKSKKIYKGLLNYRISKKKSYLDEMQDCVDEEKNQYFDGEILSQYSFTEGFVDAGAYVGDTIGCFFEHFPQYKGSYYCIEAGRAAYGRLCKNIREMDGGKIYAYQCALWEKAGKLRFDTTTFGDGNGSRVDNKGEYVDCDSLDNLLKNKDVDFIKMDIEGSEKKALIGASKIIEKNKPILAICIYHKQEDFFELPMAVQNILPNEYTFYIRQYRYGQSETVLYAMPKSRKK